MAPHTYNNRPAPSQLVLFLLNKKCHEFLQSFNAEAFMRLKKQRQPEIMSISQLIKGLIERIVDIFTVGFGLSNSVSVTKTFLSSLTGQLFEFH